MEHDEQVAFFQYLDTFLNEHVVFEYIFAIPNGGHRQMSVAKYMKKEGVKPGVLDIFVPYPMGIYHGLFIEMKYGKNKPSADQKKYIQYLKSVGYQCLVCYTGLEAYRELCKYLEIDSRLVI